jgi:uncharacterized protein
MGFIDRRLLIDYLQAQFQINWLGHHGIAHWARVRANGLMVARINGANQHVVELFAWLHDSRRINEHEDEVHGTRGASLAKKLKGRFFEATDDEMDLLVHACQHHSNGWMEADVTVMTCWDADRLDLGRVGMVPEPRYLCTEAARREAILQKANNRSQVWRQRFDAKQDSRPSG